MGWEMGDGMWQSGFGVVIVVWAPFWWEFISLKIDGVSFKILLKFPWNFFFGFFGCDSKIGLEYDNISVFHIHYQDPTDYI